MTMGERILVLRRRLKMSQAELGKASGLDSNTIARLERNELKNLLGDRIVGLARGLKVSTDVLLGVKEIDSEEEAAGAVLVGA